MFTQAIQLVFQINWSNLSLWDVVWNQCDCLFTYYTMNYGMFVFLMLIINLMFCFNFTANFSVIWIVFYAKNAPLKS